MSIKYVCSCGKHLKAPEKHAGRLHVCPACGESVQIPPLHTPEGERPPMTPQERRRLAQLREKAPPPTPIATEESPAETTTKVPDRRLIARLSRGLKQRTLRPRQRRALETRWYQCLLFPLVEWRLWLGPAIILPVPFFAVTLFLPRVVALFQDQSSLLLFMLVAWAVLCFFAVGYPCDRLWRALNDAAGGGKPGLDAHRPFPLPLLTSIVIGLVGFLAGPIIPAVALLFFWMNGGDLRWFDWAIAGLLFVSAVGGFLMVLGSFAERGWRGLNPLLVIDLTHRLNYRAATVAVIGSILVATHGALVVVGMEQIHTEPVVGASLLAGFGPCAMYTGGCLFRLVGLWCYQTRIVSQG
jgi:hypothetical protein